MGKGARQTLKRIWKFIWNDNSIWSWIINAVLAFVLIKFVVYPGLGFALHTNHPVVAVISNSMQHQADFDTWWSSMEKAYGNFGITKEEFLSFKMSNGFNKGDIIILKGEKPQDIGLGDVLVFQGGTPEPIIHRVVKTWEAEGTYYFSTKGDGNSGQREEEKEISESQIVGTGFFRIRYVGYVKIFFTDLVSQIRGVYQPG